MSNKQADKYQAAKAKVKSEKPVKNPKPKIPLDLERWF